MLSRRAATVAIAATMALAVVAAIPAAANAPSDGAAERKRHALLKRGGLSPAQIRAVDRDPGRLLRYLRTSVTVRDVPVARTSRYPRRGCHRRRTQVNYGFSNKVRLAWYRISLGWCWNKRARRVERDGPIRTDYDISSGAAVAGLRHESDQVRTSGYYRWKNARRGGYLAEGELVVHYCPGVEFGCSPTDRLIGLVAGHYDGTVTRRGYSH